MVFKIKCQVSENASGFFFFVFFFFVVVVVVEAEKRRAQPNRKSNFALVYEKAKKLSFFLKVDKTNNPSPLPT